MKDLQFILYSVLPLSHNELPSRGIEYVQPTKFDTSVLNKSTTSKKKKYKKTGKETSFC